MIERRRDRNPYETFDGLNRGESGECRRHRDGAHAASLELSEKEKVDA